MYLKVACSWQEPTAVADAAGPNLQQSVHKVIPLVVVTRCCRDQGSDYNYGIDNIQPDWQSCKRQCDQAYFTDNACQAWAYVNTTEHSQEIGQPKGACWLKFVGPTLTTTPTKGSFVPFWLDIYDLCMTPVAAPLPSVALACPYGCADQEHTHPLFTAPCQDVCRKHLQLRLPYAVHCSVQPSQEPA